MHPLLHVSATCIFGLWLLAAVASAADTAPATAPADPVIKNDCTIVPIAVPSAAMGRIIRGVIVLPPAYALEPNRRFPILYALHGRGAPFSAWSDMAPLRIALATKPMLVASFDGDQQSWYLDSPLPQTTHLRAKDIPAGTTPEPVKSLFTTFFFDEFIPWIDAQYRSDPQRRMLTGFSMGGYGALRFALHRPEMFVSLSALSGAFMSCADLNEGAVKRFQPLLGPAAESADLYRQADILMTLEAFLAAGKKLPRCSFACGSEDPVAGLLDSNRALDQILSNHGHSGCLQMAPGKHDWPYWQGASAEVIDFHWRTLP